MFGFNKFEEFVDGLLELHHGVVVVAGADELGEWKPLGGEKHLNAVGKGDAVGVVPAFGSAFEEETATFAGDDEWWKI